MSRALTPCVVVLSICCLLAAATFISDSARAADCPTTYENFGKAFMEQYCTRCHASDKSGFGRKGAPAGYDFDLVEKIAEDKGDILEWVIDKKSMPPRGDKPGADQRNKLKAWLDCEY
ncbi:MAG: cytochrome c [Candidatus Alcyoniella australis]|nr:cytochrome c [Candidatus Alcyoniella australis]